MSVEIEVQTMSDQSEAFNVILYVDVEPVRYLRLACMNREHAQRLEAALNDVAWAEDAR